MNNIVVGLLVETATAMIVVFILSMLYRYGKLHYVKDILIAFTIYVGLLGLTMLEAIFTMPAFFEIIQYYTLTSVALFIYFSGKEKGAKLEYPIVLISAGLVSMCLPWILMMSGGVGWVEGVGYFILGLTFIYNGVIWIQGEIERSSIAKVVGGTFVVYGLDLLTFILVQNNETLFLTGQFIAIILEILLACSLVLLNFVSMHNSSEVASERYKKLFENSSDAILLIHDEVIFDCNNQALKMFKANKDQIVGFKPMDLSSEYQENGMNSYVYGEELFNSASEGKVTRFDWVHQDVYGEKIQCEIGLFKIKENEFAAIIRDMSDKYAFEEALNFHMYYDSLTNLPKRDLFIDRLSLYLDERYESVALIAFNIDRFKEINDQYGHIVGDEVLKGAAERVGKVFNKEITLTRLGSDEFVILLDRLKHMNQIYIPIERISSVFRESFIVGEAAIDVSVCMGVAFPESPDTVPMELLKNVDIALNLAKENGRGKLEFYSEVGKNTFTERVTLEKEIRQGILNHEFIPYYQPIVDPISGDIVGAEALARWQREDGKMIYPDAFIPAAEETELIGLMGEQILEQACKDCKKFLVAKPDFVVHVNLSIKQVQDPNIIHKIMLVLEETELTSRHLQVELTESAFMDNAAETYDIIKKIRELGVGIALDDFGTGYSSLSYLTDMNVDTIKIDRKFVLKLPRDKKASALLTFLSQLIQDLGYKIVVEGVEEKDQLDFLVGLKCNYIQGYYYYRPMPFDRLFELLNK